MSKWLILVVSIFFTANVSAQQNNFEIRGTGSSIYLVHVVAPKENFYSVGRMFNINPKELAAFNHLHFASGLDIGQELKIPLSKNNFTQVKTSLPNETLIPVYHTVIAGETLYRLGVNYNKVSLSSLKKWNHLPSDALTVGDPMIIGFLKVDKNQSALANEPSSVNTTTTAQASQNPASPEVMQEKKEESITPARIEDQPAQPKTEPKPADHAVVPLTPPNNAPGSDTISGGYFKNLFNQQTAGSLMVNKNGMAGIFKSTSGWQDSKYYCFSNDAEAGTILKITNAASGKSVYAKVLDVIPDISQNNGLIIVISNSAADELGAGNNNFECNVNFAKK